MARTGLLLLTTLAMLAFAGNSLLCRIALKTTSIDPATFTLIRIVAGAVTLAAIVAIRGDRPARLGNWLSAFALFAYAACFSFAYVKLTAGTGALLLFGAVQLTMISYGLAKGERLQGTQIAGLLLAIAGLIGLLLPGLAAPHPAFAALMLSAGIAWGVYSLRGRGGGDPTQVTAGNFVRSVVFAALLSATVWSRFSADPTGVACAVASGAVTSGVGYALWYAALPHLQATSAATVQLSVPVVTALGGVLLLGESLTVRLVIASAAILGGIALVLLAPKGSER